MTGQGDEFKFQAPFSKPSIKLSTYDGKSSWQVYKTQFSIVADANQWDSQTKACHRLQLKSRQQKVSKLSKNWRRTSRGFSHLAFSDCPTEVREVLALQHFIDGVRDPEIESSPNGGSQGLKGGLVFAMKFEAAQQATRKDRHHIRAVNESDTSNSSVERLERQMRSFMNRVESLMSQKADGKKTLNAGPAWSRRASAEKLPGTPRR
ncbi:gag-Pol polyprotein [Trichonephila clavipes]|nr:gag-Pol polyprotein [Trichonephila clavipes]